MLLPADEASAADPGGLLDVLDALVLSGGADLDPASYGAEPHPKTVGYKAERDRFEIALCRGALERDMPVLGICRGTQILNVACGGTLDPAPRRRHPARGEPGDVLDPRGPHRAGIARGAGGGHRARRGALPPPSGARPARRWARRHPRWSVPDELVEAIEMPERSFCVGFMWHPEELRDAKPFAVLAEAAARQGVAA